MTTVFRTIDETIALGEALLYGLRRLRSLKQEESQAQRLWQAIPALMQYMQDTGAEMHVFSDGSGHISVCDADGNPIEIVWTFNDIRSLANAPIEEFPSFSSLVRKWECARPTPRAGDYRNRSTWETPGKLVATRWNNRLPDDPTRAADNGRYGGA